MTNLHNYRTGLKGVYPNPMVKRIMLEYEIARVMPMSLKIYNSAGQVVRTVVEGILEPGHYKVSWDGKDDFDRELAGGVYFLRFEAAGEKQTKKLVMLR